MARTGGERGWLLIGGLGIALVARPMACDGGPGTGDPAVAKAVAATLADTWPQVVSPALAEAEEASRLLETALVAWSSAEDTDGDAEAARLAAQEAWRAALGAWQQVEVMQLGPLGSSLTAKGGLDLRDRVYAWPTVNACAVDQQTAREGWREDGFVEASLVNVTGYAALETLLFSEPGVNACPPQVDINADGTWDGLGVDGVQAFRAAHAVRLSVGLRGAMAEARLAWEGGFADDFAAGEGPYDSPQDALNAAFDALFYLESMTKDAKLGEPLGLRDCGADTCPVESPLAGASHTWIAANLAGGRRLFTGGEGQGFDDLLAALDQEALALEVLAAFDAADAAAAAVTTPIDDPRQDAALALHAALDDLGELLKGDLATVLALRVPTEAAGDND
jgi:predicted lipoprotein